MIKFVLPRGILKVVVSPKIKKKECPKKNSNSFFTRDTSRCNNFLYFSIDNFSLSLSYAFENI